MRTEQLLVADDYLPWDLVEMLKAVSVPALPRGRHDWSVPGSMLNETVWRVSDDLRAFYGITEPLFADYVALTASSPGMSHVLHADAETLDGSPNHTRWRTVTAMIYLNTQGQDFAGGSIQFPRIDVEIAPKAGRMVGFRCDGIHAHEVPAVTSGVRRAVAMWFTPDPEYRSLYAAKP